MKLLGITSVGFDVTDKLLIRFLLLSNTGEEMGVQLDSTSAFVDFKKAYDSVRREVL
jgi:hypothetical protein